MTMNLNVFQQITKISIKYFIHQLNSLYGETDLYLQTTI